MSITFVPMTILLRLDDFSGVAIRASSTFIGSLERVKYLSETLVILADGGCGRCAHFV